MTHQHNIPLIATDPQLADILQREAARQRDQIELIASENIVSRAVLDALGSKITNKTVEGYPGRRFHGGAAIVDEVEQLEKRLQQKSVVTPLFTIRWSVI